jgi:hypothetical protein
MYKSKYGGVQQECRGYMGIMTCCKWIDSKLGYFDWSFQAHRKSKLDAQ